MTEEEFMTAESGTLTPVELLEALHALIGEFQKARPHEGPDGRYHAIAITKLEEAEAVFQVHCAKL